MVLLCVLGGGGIVVCALGHGAVTQVSRGYIWESARGLTEEAALSEMNEFSREAAHAVPNWQAPTSTGKPAGHRGGARWRMAGE